VTVEKSVQLIHRFVRFVMATASLLLLMKWLGGLERILKIGIMVSVSGCGVSIILGLIRN